MSILGDSATADTLLCLTGTLSESQQVRSSGIHMRVYMSTDNSNVEEGFKALVRFVGGKNTVIKMNTQRSQQHGPYLQTTTFNSFCYMKIGIFFSH